MANQPTHPTAPPTDPATGKPVPIDPATGKPVPPDHPAHPSHQPTPTPPGHASGQPVPPPVSGHPDQDLPGRPARPDQGLPGRPARPDQGLPSGGARPGHDLPSGGAHPDHDLPSDYAGPMTFEQAQKVMERGQKVSRAGWTGRNQWLALADGKRKLVVEPDPLPVTPPPTTKPGDLLPVPVRDYIQTLPAHTGTILPFYVLKNSGGDLQLGWQASPDDVSAHDWRIIG
jgi:hypothetical protein